MIWINAGRSGAEHESFVRSDSIPLPLPVLDTKDGFWIAPRFGPMKELLPFSLSAGAPSLSNARA